MKRAIYVAVEGSGAVVTPAETMVPCRWCGVKITAAIPLQHRGADDVVTYRGAAICVRCGLSSGVVERQVVDDRAHRATP